MSDANAKVDIDTRGLEEMRNKIISDLRTYGGNNQIRTALSQMAVDFRGFLHARFLRNSKGGGAWPGPAASTRRGRQRPSSRYRGPLNSVLIDTGTLLDSVQPDFVRAPGQFEQRTNSGVSVGIRGGSHPGGGSVGRLAEYHQFGTNRIPARPIIVAPDRVTLSKMANTLRKGVDNLIRDTRIT